MITYEESQRPDQTNLFNFPTVEQHLKNESERVRWLYEKFPTTVQSDTYLLKYYRKEFGATVNKESTIKRCGRKFRQQGLFERSEAAVLKAIETERSYMRFFTK